jgi:hypothetical protein
MARRRLSSSASTQFGLSVCRRCCMPMYGPFGR